MPTNTSWRESGEGPKQQIKSHLEEGGRGAGELGADAPTACTRNQSAGIRKDLRST